MSIDWDHDLARRARLHAALAEPARLAVVDILASGDASPSEIQRVLGLTSNLLAHHLRALEDAGVVSRTRSEGDRRRVYLRLTEDVSELVASPAAQQTSRVVFVCTHNSARSQLAAALWRGRSRVPSASAGTHPAERVHPRAIAVARRRGVKLGPARTRHVDQVLTGNDLVVSVCDHAHEELRDAVRLHWSVPDPVRAGTAAAFDRAFDELAVRVERLAPLVHKVKRGQTP